MIEVLIRVDADGLGSQSLRVSKRESTSLSAEKALTNGLQVRHEGHLKRHRTHIPHKAP